MYSITSYKDLKTEIEIAKIRIEGIQQQREQLLRLMGANWPTDIKPIDYSGMPHGSRNDMSLDRIVEGITKLDNMLFIEYTILENMENTSEKIDEKLKEFDGLEYKVAYMKEVEKKTLLQIADELGYSESYVKQISSRINKERN